MENEIANLRISMESSKNAKVNTKTLKYREVRPKLLN
jgi:hypothetical protein